ncbi:DHS-like NAD/FAD-binding domain-containing protein, partial [Dipodascopsis tothii]|uniref:DHS-like NAD/FAD-binding domain-containing protein n=1 Tax=Dipodascopsis tothii TaxID=44089 RepID=UPI0034CE5F62
MTVKVLLEDASAENGGHLAKMAAHIAKARKIIVVTGAGISCNAGIPDFRGSNGLYQMVKNEYPDAMLKGKDLFDSILFSSPASTSVFYTFMARLRTCILSARSTSIHKFIKLLNERGKLLRCYTQNIDGLEGQEGLRVGVEDWKNSEVVQLHGDIHALKCMLCCEIVSWNDTLTESVQSGVPPACPSCILNAEKRTSLGKRCPQVGVLRPNIVLYGEEHPDGENIGRCTASDFKARPDCLIICGTSLKVVGIKKLVKEAAKIVHERGGYVIYVNRTPLPASTWANVIDYYIESDCDLWVDDLKTRQPGLFLRQSNLPSFQVVARRQMTQA